MPVILTISEWTLQYDSLNGIENEIINSRKGNPPRLEWNGDINWHENLVVLPYSWFSPCRVHAIYHVYDEMA